MPSVRVKENEPFDVALRRFKRSCEKLGFWPRFAQRILGSQRERKRKGAAAVKRNLKRCLESLASLNDSTKRELSSVYCEKRPGAFCVSIIHFNKHTIQ